jgi:hypothetical protein
VKLFAQKKPAAGARAGDAGSDAATLREMAHRLDKLERVITDLKQNIDLLPAIVRKLYLADVEIPAPYDLLAERFGYLSQNDEDGLLLALFKRIGMMPATP